MAVRAGLSPPTHTHSCVEASTPQCDLFAGRLLRERVTQVTWGHENVSLIQWDWCPCKRRGHRKYTGTKAS